MGEDEKTCTKVTAHYSDGSTEDFDIFLLTAAMGLTVVGMDEGEPLYIGEKGKFSVRTVGRIAVPPDVLAAIVKSAVNMLGSLFADMPPDVALLLLRILDDMKVESTGYSKGKVKRIHPKDN